MADIEKVIGADGNPVETQVQAPEPEVATEPNEPATPETEPKEPKTPEEKPAEPQAPVEPKIEDYKFDDAVPVETITAEEREGFAKFALEKKISPEIAKTVFNYQAEAIKAQQAKVDQLKAGWQKDLIDTYGDNLKNVEVKVARVYETVDKDGQLKTIFDTVGITNHPAVVKFLDVIGDKVLEKPAVVPGSSVVPPKEKSLGDELYPDFNKTFAK